MKYKRIYIEITNICNLNCSFCSKSNRRKKEMTIKEFEEVIKKINKYTDYIYLHVKGEPLTHRYLNDILNITNKYNKKVCITTNGVLLKDKIEILKKYNNIYQINISLHSENKKENYLEDIFEAVDSLIVPYISYRFWTLDKSLDTKNNKYLDMIKEKYKVNKLQDKMKLDNKVYLSLDSKFIWPSTENDYYNEIGTCLGGKRQLAILTDGTVSICCLDSEGESNLGNIYTTSLEAILNTEKYKSTIKDFNNNKSYLEICKHCSYKERFNKKNT